MSLSVMWDEVDYGRDEGKCPSDESVDAWIVVRSVVVVEPWCALWVKMFLDLRVSDTAHDCHESEHCEVDKTGNASGMLYGRGREEPTLEG